MNSIIYPMIIIYIGRNYWVIILLLGFIHLNYVRIKFLLDVINNMWACNPIKIMNLWARLTTYFYMCFLKTLLLQVPHIRAQPPWWLGQRDSALWWMLPTTAAAGSHNRDWLWREKKIWFLTITHIFLSNSRGISL